MQTELFPYFSSEFYRWLFKCYGRETVMGNFAGGYARVRGNKRFEMHSGEEWKISNR
jgi:hypothetical protein